MAVTSDFVMGDGRFFEVTLPSLSRSTNQESREWLSNQFPFFSPFFG
jgi:hypothetical protein